jgi:hypothetical protein
VVVIGRQPIDGCLIKLVSAMGHFSDLLLSSAAWLWTRFAGGPGRPTSRTCKCASLSIDLPARLPRNTYLLCTLKCLPMPRESGVAYLVEGSSGRFPMALSGYQHQRDVSLA